MTNQKAIGVAYQDQQIIGGSIDNTVIGGQTPAAATFTTVSATTLNATTITGSATPSGAAGGDLSGTYPNPTVAKVNGTAAGTMANQNANAVAVTGGAINGTPIGQSTPAAGAFTGINATSANVLGVLSAEGVNSTSNGQAASISNTGTFMSPTFAAQTYYDSSRSANNKIADLLWSAGTFSARFKNDAENSTVTWLSAAGGQAAGITGITSNSGSGAWAHTGNFSVSGTSTLTGAVSLPGGTTGPVTLSQGYTVATLPAASTALKGARAFVTDSANPTYNSQVVGGGANTVPVFCNGNVWVWA